MDKLGFTPAKNFLAEWVAECQVTDAFSLIHKANLSVHSANEDVLHGLYTILPQMISSKLQRERTVPLVEFLYPVFTCMPGESCRRSLLLCLCVMSFECQLTPLCFV